MKMNMSKMKTQKNKYFKILKANKSYETKKKTKLVILGTGWGGYKIAKNIDINQYDLNVVSPRNHFLFTPLLPSTATGTLEFRGVIEPIRTCRDKINYVQASCIRIDPVEKLIECENYYDTRPDDSDVSSKPHFTMKYDELVISVGATSNTFGIEGVEKYCFSFKQLKDARLVRNRIIECFERAANPYISEGERDRLLSFVVVGGGATSCELISELYDFISVDLKKWYADLMPHIKLTLIEASSHVLGSFGQNLAQYTMRLFRSRNIKIITNASVVRVDRHEMHLKDGSKIKFGLGVWATGNTSIPLIRESVFEKTKNGRIIINENCEIPAYQNVYAVGDCAAYNENALPQTAQVAQQQGAYIANYLNLKAKLRGDSLASDLVTEKVKKQLGPFAFKFRGQLAYVGKHNALVDMKKVQSSGFFSWLFWNAAYITNLVSIQNKIIIPMYWLKSFLFGRDISRF